MDRAASPRPRTLPRRELSVGFALAVLFLLLAIAGAGILRAAKPPRFGRGRRGAAHRRERDDARDPDPANRHLRSDRSLPSAGWCSDCSPRQDGRCRSPRRGAVAAGAMMGALNGGWSRVSACPRLSSRSPRWSRCGKPCDGRRVVCGSRTCRGRSSGSALGQGPRPSARRRSGPRRLGGAGLAVDARGRGPGCVRGRVRCRHRAAPRPATRPRHLRRIHAHGCADGARRDGVGGALHRRADQRRASGSNCR